LFTAGTALNCVRFLNTLTRWVRANSLPDGVDKY